jgi:hypothetical protein
MMLKIIESDYRGTIHIGGGRKTVYEYALRLGPRRTVGALSTSDVSFKVPKDTSLDVGLYKSIFVDKSREK